jgi:SAM-dependent methyltransferase
VWFAAVGGSQATAAGDPAGPRFLPVDLIDYAEQVRGGARPPGSPAAVDVVLFRCSLCRVSRRDLLLEAAFQLLRPGGLVVATDWIQTRTTDRITWAHLLGTGRLVDLETEHGHRRLCHDTGFTAFQGWRQKEAMQRCFQRRLERTRRKLADERGEDRRSPFDRAFLLRARRDLEVLAAMSAPGGPLGWLFWAARKPGPG